MHHRTCTTVHASLSIHPCACTTRIRNPESGCTTVHAPLGMHHRIHRACTAVHAKLYTVLLAPELLVCANSAETIDSSPERQARPEREGRQPTWSMPCHVQRPERKLSCTRRRLLDCSGGNCVFACEQRGAPLRKQTSRALSRASICTTAPALHSPSLWVARCSWVEVGAGYVCIARPTLMPNSHLDF